MGSLIFLNSIPVNCPFCGQSTVYRRSGLDGMDGEGQYCNKDRRFIVQRDFDTIDVKDIEGWKNHVKEWYKKNGKSIQVENSDIS